MKVLKVFFISLGVIFSILIIVAAYIWIADPFNLKPLLSAGGSPVSIFKAVTSGSVEVDNVDKNPLLTEEQEAQLESYGIEPASLPKEITPAMEACFVLKLGTTRANEIIQGDPPTSADFFKASSCLNLK